MSFFWVENFIQFRTITEPKPKAWEVQMAGNRDEQGGIPELTQKEGGQYNQFGTPNLDEVEVATTATAWTPSFGEEDDESVLNTSNFDDDDDQDAAPIWEAPDLSNVEVEVALTAATWGMPDFDEPDHEQDAAPVWGTPDLSNVEVETNAPGSEWGTPCEPGQEPSGSFATKLGDQFGKVFEGMRPEIARQDAERAEREADERWEYLTVRRLTYHSSRGRYKYRPQRQATLRVSVFRAKAISNYGSGTVDSSGEKENTGMAWEDVFIELQRDRYRHDEVLRELHSDSDLVPRMDRTDVTRRRPDLQLETSDSEAQIRADIAVGRIVEGLPSS